MLNALIKNNLVVGIVDLADDEISFFASHYEQVIDVTQYTPTPVIGSAFDGVNISGSNISRKITRLAMNQRFQVSEMLGLLTYVNSNPTSIVALLLQRLQMATFVDLSRSDTIAGIGVLVSFTLLTSDRASAILNTTPTPVELYVGPGA